MVDFPPFFIELILISLFSEPVGNSPENKSSPNEIQTIGDQHQSHPIYNGDVSENKYESPRGK